MDLKRDTHGSAAPSRTEPAPRTSRDKGENLAEHSRVSPPWARVGAWRPEECAQPSPRGNGKNAPPRRGTSTASRTTTRSAPCVRGAQTLLITLRPLACTGRGNGPRLLRSTSMSSHTLKGAALFTIIIHALLDLLSGCARGASSLRFSARLSGERPVKRPRPVAAHKYCRMRAALR